MKVANVLVALTIGGLCVLLFVHAYLHFAHHQDEGSGGGGNSRHAVANDVQHLLDLIRAQNDTIGKLSLLLQQEDAQNRELKATGVAKCAATCSNCTTTSSSTSTTSSSSSSSSSSASVGAGSGVSISTFSSQLPPPVGIDGACERAYGLSLVDEWRGSAQTWCASEATPAGLPESKLVCYPYHQQHKRRDGRGPDLFCQATNFLVDFSKVQGSHAATGKPPLGQQYYHFMPGSLSSTCKRTPQYRHHLFMPHHSLQMDSFEPDLKRLPKGYTVEETATYLLARDEDCENSFHSTADFMNMFLVLTALRQSPKDLQVLLFDRHSDGPYTDLIQRAFSGGRAPMRKEAYNNGRVLFRNLIFHLESPAGLIFPKCSRPDPLRCRGASLFTAYSRFVLEAFDLLDVAPPAIPQVVLSLRHRTESKNVGRILANEKEVVTVLREGNMMNLEVVDTASMPYAKQLELIRRTNVLVGVHGAGLMLIMFAANEAVLVELHPSYRQDRHFRYAARMAGKLYMPLRSTIRETCHGSSDNVVVPVDEFRRVMDGALRLARNFDDGISECGLYCPPGVLALDTRLQPYYKAGEARASTVNTAFPC